MKERPILFSGPMVRAILEGRKTQTRRVVGNKRVWWSDLIQDSEIVNGKEVALGFEDVENGGWHKTESACPYGQPGDRLWVRETTWECADNNDQLHYVADGPAPTTDRRNYKKRPSIFMPRSASRITLEITGVRVERLNDISEGDAIAEGCFLNRCPCPQMQKKPRTPIEASFRQTGCHKHGDEFRYLWESINGKGTWDVNPWVWVIEFKPVQPGGGK